MLVKLGVSLLVEFSGRLLGLGCLFEVECVLFIYEARVVGMLLLLRRSHILDELEVGLSEAVYGLHEFLL